MNKIGNVSFGAIYTVRETPIITQRQREIEDNINKIFKNEICNNNLRFIYLNQANSIEKIIEQELCQDLFVRHKTNGDVVLFLKNTDSYLSQDNKPNYYVKLKIKAELPFPIAMNLIKAFSSYCLNLAKFYKEI